MLTTIGDCAFAMLRNVVASMEPAIGALLVAGMVMVCADDAGARPRREATTIPTTSEAMATRTREKTVVFRDDDSDDKDIT